MTGKLTDAQARDVPDSQMMPKEPTPAMLAVMLERGATTNPKNPKAGAWDALITYHDLFAALAEHERTKE